MADVFHGGAAVASIFGPFSQLSRITGVFKGKANKISSSG